MKVAKSLLNRIVKEEYSRASARRERVSRVLSEGGSSAAHAYHLAAVEADDLIEFASRWAEAGRFIQENIQQLVTGDFSDIDPQAIQEAQGLRGFHPHLDEAFSEYEKHVKGDD